MDSENAMGEIPVQEVGYLNTTAGTIDGVGEVVILTLRPDAGSFRPHNVALTAAQGQRLMSDLNRLFEDSTTLQEWKKNNPTAVIDENGDDDLDKPDFRA